METSLFELLEQDCKEELKQDKLSDDDQTDEEESWQEPVHWPCMIVKDWWPSVVGHDNEDAYECIIEIVEVPVWNGTFHVLNAVFIVVRDQLVVLIKTKLSRKDLEAKNCIAENEDEHKEWEWRHFLQRSEHSDEDVVELRPNFRKFEDSQ